MKKIALLGYKGMVGKVFLERFKKQNIKMKIFLFGSSKNKDNFVKGYNLKKIKKFLYIVCCKDNNFSKNYYRKLKNAGWDGYWIDASSYFRLSNKSVLSLDLINKKDIIQGIKNGKKIFSGCNCTVSIMLIAIGGLIKKKIINEIICNTYQSVSGSGFLNTYNFFKNCYKILNKIFINKNFFINLNNNINEKLIKKNNLLSFSICPWIGEGKKDTSEEEKKASLETCKLLNYKLKVFSTCVRVNSYRCHSESIILFLKKDISLKKFKKILSNFSRYVKIIKNKKKNTENKLNPLYVSEKNIIYIGRIRKIGIKKFSIFVIGDQLIWGAAEPLLRVLKIIKNVS
ncbi:aspartate-semialdehyde dehydrogenase [Candidatus Vidania fulgoroideorum]